MTIPADQSKSTDKLKCELAAAQARIVELERELALARQQYSELVSEYAKLNAAQDKRIAELEHGEYICKKCGIRKNAEFESGDF